MQRELVESVLNYLGATDEISTLNFSLVKSFLSSLSSHYYHSFTFRAVFDAFFRGGVRNYAVPPFNHSYLKDRIGNSDELILCNLFLQISTRLAEKYCAVYAKKKRPYEMISLLLFNHYYSFKGQHFCDVGGASSPQIILQLLGASRHTIMESPDYVEIHGDIFARHNIKSADFNHRVTSLKCNLEDFRPEKGMPGIGRVFSMNCFEHIMDLDQALSTLYQNCCDQSYIYSTFYPIFSYFDNGDHGSISQKYKLNNPGLHHYSPLEQRKAIKKNFPEYTESMILKTLSDFNFNQTELINKHTLEDFRKIFYSSNFNLLSCQDINTSLFAWSHEHKLAYKRLTKKLTSFPEAIGLRAILKKGAITPHDCLMTNGLISFASL